MENLTYIGHIGSCKMMGRSSINQMRSSQVLSRQETRFINSGRVPSITSRRNINKKRKRHVIDFDRFLLFTHTPPPLKKKNTQHGTIKGMTNYFFVGWCVNDVSYILVLTITNLVSCNHINMSDRNWYFIDTSFANFKPQLLTFHTHRVTPPPPPVDFPSSWTSQTHLTGRAGGGERNRPKDHLQAV